MKKVLSLVLVFVMTAGLFVMPSAANEEASYVYYDSAAAWTEDWTGSTNGNDSGLIMAGFSLGAWVNGTLSGGKATFANLNAPEESNIKIRDIKLLNSALSTTADYTTPAYRKLSMNFTINKFSGNQSILWHGLQMATKEVLLSATYENVGTYASYSTALADCADTDYILYITDSIYGNAKDVNMKVYPICVLKSGEENSVEYIFDGSKIYSVKVNGVTYTSAMDGTDFREGFSVRSAMNMKSVENASGDNAACLAGNTSLTFSLYRYEGISEIPLKYPDSEMDILIVGCSYGADTMELVKDFMYGLGKTDANLGRLFMGSQHVKTHYDWAVNNTASYGYFEVTPGTRYWVEDKTKKYSVMDALSLRDWEVVVIQTTTGVCSVESEYLDAEGNSYAKLMADYVKENEPGASIVWNMVWADPETVVGTAEKVSSYISNIHGNSLKMYKGIMDSVQAQVLPYVKGNGVATDDVIDAIIPTGTTIQNMEGLGISEEDVYRDAVHLNTTDGRYAAALTATCAIFAGAETVKDTAVTVDAAIEGYVSDSVNTKGHIELIRQAAKDALSYPFKSPLTAKKLVEEGMFNLRPNEIAEEASAKTLLLNKVSELVADTGIEVGESDITINNFSATSSFTMDVAFENGTKAENVDVIVSEAFTVTPLVKANSDIPVVGELSFVFDMEMNADTLNCETVLLKEKIKSPAEGAATHNERLYKSSYDADQKTFTITFDEGDIAPGMEYTVEFTTAVKSVDNVTLDSAVGFTYTTEYDKYYINDNFSRFPEGVQLSTTASVTSMLPYQYSAQLYTGGGNVTAKIVKEADGSKAMYAKAEHSSSTNCGYIWGYRRDYLPQMEDRAYFTEHEVELKFDGDDDAIYMVWTGHFLIKKAADGKFYLHTTTSSAATSVSYMATVNTRALCEVTEGEKIKIKFVIYRKKVTSGERTRGLYKLYVDNGNGYEEIKQVVDSFETDEQTGAITAKYRDLVTGEALSADATGNLEYASAGNTTGTFGVRGESGKTAELWIYSLKYAPYEMVSCEPANGAENVPIDSDVVLTFNAPVDPDTLSKITVTDDGDAEIAYKGEYDSEKNTYTISFVNQPLYFRYYKITIPADTVKTDMDHPIDECFFQFQFEKSSTKVVETASSVSGTTLSKTVKITEAVPGTVVLAVYSGGKLLDLASFDITAESSEAEDTLSVTAEEIGDSTKTVSYKIMYFDDFSKMSPLTAELKG